MTRRAENMTIKEKLLLGDKFSIAREVAARLGDDTEFREIPRCPAKLQWLMLKDAGWIELYNEDNWYCKNLANIIGFKEVKAPSLETFEKLRWYSDREKLANILLGADPEIVRNLPSWVTFEMIQAEPRLAANVWVKNYNLSILQYQKLTDKDIDFLVTTRGLVGLEEDRTVNLQLAKKFQNEEDFAAAVRIWRMTGKVPKTLDRKKVWGDLAVFSDELITYLWGNPFLELLHGQVPEENALIEQEEFYTRCKFEKFTSVPEIMLKSWKNEIPQQCFFTPENIKFLEEENFDFCIQFGEAAKGKGRVTAFRLLQHPFEEWKEHFGDLVEELLEYPFDWTKENIKHYDIITEIGIKGSIQDAAVPIIQSHYYLKTYLKAPIDSKQCWKKAIELEESGFLTRFNSVFSDYWNDQNALTRLGAVFVDYLHGRSVGIPDATGRTVDFVEAFERAERCIRSYKCSIATLALNFLDANRFEQDDRAMIVVNKFEDGKLTPVTIEESAQPEGDFLWGITCAPFQVRLRGSDTIVELFPRLGVSK